MRPVHPPRRQVPVAAALVGALLLAILAALPALAKEVMEAVLDAPIAMDTPGGTELLVGITVTIADESGTHPVEGSPIYLALTGRDGSSTRAGGRVDGEPGHYLVRIVVPAGGPRAIEVDMHGTSDIAIRLMEDPFAFGGITARTAQVAPPLAPALTPVPRDPVPVAKAAELAAPQAEVEPAGSPETAGASAGVGAPLLVGLAAAGVLALVAAVLIAARRSRAASRPDVAGRPRGA